MENESNNNQHRDRLNVVIKVCGIGYWSVCYWLNNAEFRREITEMLDRHEVLTKQSVLDVMERIYTEMDEVSSYRKVKKDEFNFRWAGSAIRKIKESLNQD